MKANGIRYCVGVAGILLLVLIFSCTPTAPDRRELKDIWISTSAENIKYQEHAGSYQALYTLKECYPAKASLDEMAGFMLSKKWRRLSMDPLNPGLTLNHARKQDGKWGSFLFEDAWMVYTWMDYWENDKGDIVWYRFRYQVDKSKKPEDNCEAACSAAFVPHKVWKENVEWLEQQRKNRK